jgi:hypothetical protein
MFNFISGEDICTIKENDKFKNKKIYLNNKDTEDYKTFSELTLDKGVFQLVPNRKKDRATIACLAPAGAGKTYFTAAYIKEYHKVYPHNEIFFFSEKPIDKVIDDIGVVQRVEIDDSWIADPIDWKVFNDCLCIFDDVDGLNKKHREPVYELRDKLYKLARANRVSVIATNHALCNSHETKTMLRESDIIVFFPKKTTPMNMKYLVENYTCITKEDLSKIKKAKTRWCCYIKYEENVVLTEKNLFICSVE